jgi:hypothetical protein
MSNLRLGDIIKSATEVNLRYSASALNLSKDYLKAFARAVTNESPPEGPDDQEEAAAGPEPGPRPSSETRRAPLIVAGRTGDTANAAFAVNNTSQMSGTVTLQAVGDFAGTKVTVDPETLTLKNGEGAIIRILAAIGKQTPVDVDHPGIVVIPELGLQIAEFMVRRLPDPPAKKKPASRRPARKKT